MSDRRDDDMPVPPRPGKIPRAVVRWVGATVVVCLIAAFWPAWAWRGARIDGDDGRAHLLVLAVVVILPAVVWSVLGLIPTVRRVVARAAVRTHLVPAEAHGRTPAVLPVCFFVGAFMWWIMLLSASAWSFVAVGMMFAMPAVLRAVDADSISGSPVKPSWLERRVDSRRGRR